MGIDIPGDPPMAPNCMAEIGFGFNVNTGPNCPEEDWRVDCPPTASEFWGDYTCFYILSSCLNCTDLGGGNWECQCTYAFDRWEPFP